MLEQWELKLIKITKIKLVVVVGASIYIKLLSIMYYRINKYF